MKNEQKHNIKLPLTKMQYKINCKDTDRNAYPILDENTVLVAYIFEKDNAKKIILAINMHDELVNRLKEAHAIILRIGDEYSDVTHKHDSFTVAEDRRIMEAIKQAEQ